MLRHLALALLVAPVACAPIAQVPPAPVAEAPAAGPSTWDALLAAAEAAPPRERQALVDAFLADRPLPLTGEAAPGEAVFLLRGPHATADAVVAGDFDGWSATPTSAVEGTDTRYARVPLPDDARVDYKLVVGGEYLLDPANPRTCPSGFGDNSELAMPAYVAAADLAFDPAIAHGTLNGAAITGDALPAPLTLEGHDVFVYVAAGADAAPGDDGVPLLVVHDGGDYLRLGHMQHVLDATIARGEVQPLVVAFIAPVEREAEYVGARVDEYVELIGAALVPFVAAEVAPLALASDGYGVWGTSFSGFIAVKIAATLPAFTRVVSQSGRVRIDGGDAIDALAARDGVHVWLDTGTIFDTATENQSARDDLEGGGVTLDYLEVNEGHSWGSWRARLGPALRALYAP